MGVTVDELLQKPFAHQTLRDQIRIVLEGKPRPTLNMSAVTVGDDGMITTRNFEPAMYNQVLWLTGSETQQSFFCWPCLLYVKNPVWKIDDLAFLSEGISKHEKTPYHIQAALNFKTFVSQHLKVQKLSMDEYQFNEMVQRNRDILKFLINAVSSIIVKSQPPRKKTEGQCRIKPENCVKVLKFQRKYAGRCVNQVDEAIELVKTSPILLDDLVDAITKVLKITVKKEVLKSTFASLIFSEHCTYPSKSQISTVLRYIKNGKACERFLGYTNSLDGKSASVIQNLISSVVQEFEISKKFLTYSFDGAILRINELSDVIYSLDRGYPHSYFVPSYYHELFSILQQGLAEYKECAQFLKILGMMEIYFMKTSKQWKAFESFMLGNISLLGHSKWSSDAPFIKIVNSCRKYFAEFLGTIVQNCTKWGADDIVNACGFQQYLKEFQTIFLLQVFSSVIQKIANLDKALKSNALENTFGSDIVSVIMKDLSNAKTTGFENIWNSTIQENGDHYDQGSKRFKIDLNEKKDHYCELYNNIFDHIIQVISLRFNSLDKLEFCGMLNKENGIHSIDDSGLDSFFNYYLMQTDSRAHDFDLERLRNEVKVLRNNGEIFADKKIYDLLEFLTDLKDAFKNVNKLAEFILTMPFNRPSLDNDSSKFEKINKFAYSTCSKIVSGDISVLHVESDHLQDIKRNIFFYEEVISKFFEVNRSVELMLQKT